MASNFAQNASASQKVLVVEDEPGLRFIISDVLTNDHGLEVVEAESGDQALDLLQHDGDIGCVFTDVRMPGKLDGLALSRLVLRDHPGVKILMTSGHLSPADALEDIPFVSKPYDLTQVAARIDQLIKQLGPRGNGRG